MALKYKVEGGLNFYDELYKQLDDPAEANATDLQSLASSECLISGESLNKEHVTLQCGHKFNYIPLFLDLKSHRQKFNMMEITRVCGNEIRCPYCRNRQKTLLTYSPDIIDELIVGVNCPTINYITNMFANDEGVENGTCSYCCDGGEPCSNSHVYTLFLDNKQYCKQHRNHTFNTIVQKYSINTAEPHVAAAGKVVKAVKSAKKKPFKNINSENIIINSHTGDIIIKKCSAVLKSGLHKGEPCGKFVNNTPNGYCGVHRNYTCKSNVAE